MIRPQGYSSDLTRRAISKHFGDILRSLTNAQKFRELRQGKIGSQYTALGTRIQMPHLVILLWLFRAEIFGIIVLHSASVWQVDGVRDIFLPFAFALHAIRTCVARADARELAYCAADCMATPPTKIFSLSVVSTTYTRYSFIHISISLSEIQFFPHVDSGPRRSSSTRPLFTVASAKKSAERKRRGTGA